ncbi:hypothetical protein [Tsukamurella soli]|uniref:DUF1801 domain-containing protein n=1 Tax=Tsukamurella soli TaxID=644556 RepID=A0ABP8JWT5_9ACTN
MTSAPGVPNPHETSLPAADSTGLPAAITDFLETVPEDRRTVIRALYDVITARLGRRCEAVVEYGMISWIVPASAFSKGHSGDPRTPLPFLSLASQRGGISIYHLGLYGDEQISSWFRERYARLLPDRCDGVVGRIGTRCLRFSDPRQIPIALIGELAAKVGPAELVGCRSTPA